MKTLILITSIVITIYVIFIARSVNKQRYLFRVISSVLLIIVAFLVKFNWDNEDKFEPYLLFSLLPALYLIYYEVLKVIMRPWIGNFPYAPHWEKVGNSIIVKGYPKGRLVTKSDHVFRILFQFLPLLTLLIIEIFKN